MYITVNMIHSHYTLVCLNGFHSSTYEEKAASSNILAEVHSLGHLSSKLTSLVKDLVHTSDGSTPTTLSFRCGLNYFCPRAEVDLFFLLSDPLRTVTCKSQTPILSIIISSSSDRTESEEDCDVEGGGEMTQQSEQGWEEVQGIQEESNQRTRNKVQELV